MTGPSKRSAGVCPNGSVAAGGVPRREMATRESLASASLFAMGVSDDNSAVERYFDELGEKEWDRLEIDLRSRVSLEMHHRFLRR